MANKRTSSSQAIKDMLAENLDITFFIGNILTFHMLNAGIGIITKEKAVKVEKPKKVKPKRVWRRYTSQPVKHRFNTNITVNPDGTVSLGFTSEWDYK